MNLLITDVKQYAEKIVGARDERLQDITFAICRYGISSPDFFAAHDDNYEADLHMMGFDAQAIDMTFQETLPDCFEIPKIELLKEDYAK